MLLYIYVLRILKDWFLTFSLDAKNAYLKALLLQMFWSSSPLSHSFTNFILIISSSETKKKSPQLHHLFQRKQLMYFSPFVNYPQDLYRQKMVNYQ